MAKGWSRIFAFVTALGGAELAATDPTWALSCPMENQFEIIDAPFHVAYESWAKPGWSGSSFRYGRCVAVLNGQSAKIDWRGTQLRGVATPEQPIKLELPFIREATEERDSELRYGVNAVPERMKNVNFLANAAEASDRIAMMAARINDWKLRAVQGESIPNDIKETSSEISLSFYAGNDDPIRLDLTFWSGLDIGNAYTYRIDYSLAGRATNTDTPQIVLRPVSGFLRNAISASDLGEGSIALNENFGKDVTFQSVPEQTDPLARQTTQSTDTIEVLGDGKVLASFPVALYLPEGAL